MPPSPQPFLCKEAKPIDELTMIWNGTVPIRVKAYKGDPSKPLVADIDNIAVGEEVTISGFAGSPNDINTATRDSRRRGDTTSNGYPP